MGGCHKGLIVVKDTSCDSDSRGRKKMLIVLFTKIILFICLLRILDTERLEKMVNEVKASY